MRTRFNKGIVGVLAAVLVVVGVSVSADRAFAGSAGAGGSGTVVASARSGMVGGIAFDHLPAGLGHRSDFEYWYQAVHFVSRVWESHTSAGYRVDLDIGVLRAKRFVDGPAFHDWLVRYEDRAPAEAHYIAVRLHGHDGWLGRGQLFWLQQPGLGVTVSLDHTRWSIPALARTGWSAHLASPVKSMPPD